MNSRRTLKKKLELLAAECDDVDYDYHEAEDEGDVDRYWVSQGRVDVSVLDLFSDL